MAGSVTYYEGNYLAQTAVGSSGQILQSNGASAPSWVAASSSFAWNTISATPQALSSQNGYIIEDNTPGAETILTLPSSPTVGDTIKIMNFNSSGWQINQAAGEMIFVGNIATVAGTSHGIIAADIGTSITLVCIATAPGIWAADGSPQGNIGFY